MIGWGAHFQISGLGHQEPGTGDQVRVAGIIHSALHVVLNSVLRGQARQLGQHAVLTLPQVSVRR